MARAYKRESRYSGAPISVLVSVEHRAALEAVADAANRPLASVVRDCIQRGLPLVRDAARKQRRQQTRQTERQGVEQ